MKMQETLSPRTHRRLFPIAMILALGLSVPNALAGDRPTRDASKEAEKPTVQFVPQTRSERFSNYVASVTNLESVIRAAAEGGIAQAEGTPKEWAGGGDGYGKRLGNAYAEHGIRQTLQYGVSAALHEDNRYFASGRSGFFPRAKYAIASVFLARHDDGSRNFSFSRLSSAAGAAFISRAWQPRSTTTAGDGAVGFGITMGGDLGFNVLREFWPGLKFPFKRK